MNNTKSSKPRTEGATTVPAAKAVRTIAILNLKGGVGKTATAVNLAAILATDYNQQVLLVDADAQCNSTEFYGGDPDEGSLAEVLRAGPEFAGDYAVTCIQHSNYPGVDLLAADDSLMDLDLTAVSLEKAGTGCLRDMAKILSRRGMYDFILIDCPPAFNAASAAALVAADSALIPMKLDAFSLRGMSNIMRQLKNMQAVNPKLRLAGLLPTMWYNSKTIKDAEAQLVASGLPVYSHIRRTPTVDVMTFAQQPIIVSSPRSAAAADYRKLAADVMSGRC